MCTRTSPRLRSRRCATAGGTGKIAVVRGSLVRMSKLLSKMCLTCELKGWYVRTRAILRFHAHLSRALLGGLRRIPVPEGSVSNRRDSQGCRNRRTFLGISAGRHHRRKNSEFGTPFFAVFRMRCCVGSCVCLCLCSQLKY